MERTNERQHEMNNAATRTGISRPVRDVDWVRMV